MYTLTITWGVDFAKTLHICEDFQEAIQSIENIGMFCDIVKDKIISFSVEKIES